MVIAVVWEGVWMGEGGLLRGLTFELRRDQRQDARPGPVKMYAYHRPGPGGLPLGLASNEGLGVPALRCEASNEVRQRMISKILELPSVEEATVAGRARFEPDVRLTVIDHPS